MSREIEEQGGKERSRPADTAGKCVCIPYLDIVMENTTAAKRALIKLTLCQLERPANTKDLHIHTFLHSYTKFFSDSISGRGWQNRDTNFLHGGGGGGAYKSRGFE